MGEDRARNGGRGRTGRGREEVVHPPANQGKGRPSAPGWEVHAPRRHGPVIVDVEWPWVHRYRRGWAPRYMYRQVVFVESGWGHRRRDSRIDVRTFYRHRVRHASWNRAEVDVYLDRIEVYDDGYFVGEVDRIPSDLSRIRATIDRSGRVRFDRDVFIVGDPYTGFELISTRHYNGFVLDLFDRSHGFRAGVLDFRRERVVPVRRSRLFDPYGFDGYVPISLLPQDADWLCDYGASSYSGRFYRDDDRYFYGRGDDAWDDYGESYGYERDERRDSDGSWGRSPSRAPLGEDERGEGVTGWEEVKPLQHTEERAIESERSGARIKMKRQVELRRVE